MRKKHKNWLGVGLIMLMGIPLAFNTITALAWGPTDRPTYTMAAPADHAVFNSIIDSSSIGDERDFVKIVEKGVGGTYSSKITLEPNKEYDVYIYYHNDASATYNDKAHSYAGVATDARLAASFPLELAAGEEGAVSGVISWTNLADRDTKQEVWDEAWVTASEDMTLHYVTDILYMLIYAFFGFISGCNNMHAFFHIKRLLHSNFIPHIHLLVSKQRVLHK